MHPRKPALLLLTLLLTLVGAAQATTLLVTSAADNGSAGTLRTVIASASPGDNIIFATNLSSSTITLTNGQLSLNKNLAIDASGLTDGIILDANGASRIFEVDSGPVVLTSLNIINGNDTGGNAGGGGILNYTTLTLNNCTLAGNSANQATWGGGGILSYNASLTLNQCTLAGNAANNSTAGGGLVLYGGSVSINQCTLSGNSATDGGGIENAGGSLTFSNSIIVTNTPDNITGPSTATGVNLTSGDPLLSPLSFYGGPTATMPPLPGSPAIDACTGTSFTKDQRGLPRPSGPAADIGAVELQFTPVVLTATDGGFGSLRYAIANVTNGVTITFSNSLAGTTLTLTNELLLNKSLTIDATGLSSPVTISGNHASRVFRTTAATTNVLTSLVISNGYVSASGNTSGQGGAIYNAGTLTLNRDTVTASSAVGTIGLGTFGTTGGTGGNGQTVTGGNGGPGQGGGLYNVGTLTLNQATVSSNSATGGVGGLCVGGQGGNGLSSGGTSGGDAGPGGNGTGGTGGNGLGGGIFNAGTLFLNQDTLAGNTAIGGAGGKGTGGNGGIGGVGSIADGKGGNGGNGSGGTGGSGAGGGIYNLSGSQVINQDTVAANATFVGAAGAAQLGTGGHGGAIAGNGSNGSAFPGSPGTVGSGGIYIGAGTVALTNTIVSANTASNSANNISGTFAGTNNLFANTLVLSPLSNYGGPTPTMPPLISSGALDACLNGTSFAFDQRGFPRGRDGTAVGNLRSDIGAVEVQTPPLNGPEDIVVTTTADELDPSGVFGTGMSLREAVRDVAVGRNINFDPSLTGQTIILTNGELFVTKNLNINAIPGTGSMTISGNHTSRIFSLTNSITASFSGLILTNGNGVGASLSAYGGAILNFGNLTLSNCRLVGNQADGNIGGGGALVSVNGSLHLNFTTVAGNVSDYCSGILIQDQSATINACTISANSGATGMAVDLQSSLAPTTLFMLNSTLSGNVCTFTNNLGAALAIFSGSGSMATATLTNCTITGNLNNYAGQPGGISVESDGASTLTLFNTIVSSNTAGGVPTDITGNASASSAFNLIGSGGALVNGINGNLVGLNDPRLAPLGSYGGSTQTQPPLLGSPAIDAGGSTTLGSDQTGAARLSGPATDIGAVELQFSPVVATNSDHGFGSLRYAITYANPGTAITFNNALAGSVITLNSGEILLNKNLTIDGSSLSTNGGITLNGSHTNRLFEINNGASVTFKSLVLSNGLASGASGGAIYNNSGSTGTVQNCYVVGCSADIYGGGILNNGTLTLLNSTVAGNHAAQFGGGINNDGTLFVNQSTLAANSAGNGGGGISSGGQVTVIQSTITTNTAGTFAGGINYGAGAMALFNTIAAGNSAPSIADVSGSYTGATNQVGGNVQLAPLGFHGGPTPTMPPLPGSALIDAGNDSVSSSFTTDQRGLARIVGPHADLGAVEFQDASPLVVNNSDSGIGSLRYATTYSPSGTTVTFATNLSGATISVSNALTLNHSLTIDGSVLSPGITIDGGNQHLLFNVSGGTVLLDSLALVKGAGGQGGAILNSANLTVNRCTLSQNTAVAGGGICNSAGVLTVNQSTFTANSENAAAGGAIYSSGGVTIFLTHCTIVQNSANTGLGQGGGIWSDGPVLLENSIVAANTSSSSGADIYAPSISFTGPNIVNQVSGSISGTLPINVAPNLYPLGNYGGPTRTMPAQPGSQAIDNAIATSLTSDQRGFPRPLGLAADLGAVEGTINTNGIGRLAAPTRLPNGTTAISFSNYTDIPYTVLASSNISLPLNLWSNLGPVTDSPAGSGHYQFTDSQSTNAPARFYLIRTP